VLKIEVKKLELNRTTVRRLTEEEARSVKGALPTVRCGSRVSACCPCTGTSTIGPTQPLVC
jgi:hypothetical protein